MLKRFALSGGRLEEADDEGKVIVVVNPDESEKKYLIAEYQVDEHTLNSALDPDELARIEFEPRHMAFIFKRPKNYSSEDNFLFKVMSTGMFLYKDVLIIVMADEMFMFQDKIFMGSKTIQDVFLRIIYRSIYHFLDHLKAINMISDSLEQKVNTSMENRYLLNMFTLQKGLVYYQNAVNINGYVIDKLKANAKKIGFTTDNQEFLEDIIIENSQCYKQAEIYSNILASLMDARASIVSNNLNVLMKTLNIITIAIMVPTFVVSAFSMNVDIPLQGHPFAFWIVMGLAMVMLMVFILFWKYKKWW
ncbi:MAG: magnesium transporter CorA family protein [Spirochaetes bacterium]|nr:MAG: magnesium transporter CorA family protein [Spirochaetota bacterium]